MKDKGITNGKNRNIVAEELNVDMGDMLSAIGEVVRRRTARKSI